MFDEYVIRGSTAVLRCHIPEYIKPYVSVMSWIMNSEFEIVGHGMHSPLITDQIIAFKNAFLFVLIYMQLV